jgi:chemotaxis protein histidine kinase CheA
VCGHRSDIQLSVRTVETGGARFALPEDNIIAVLKLIGDEDPVYGRAALRDMVDELVLPLVSLGEHLSLPETDTENEVVVLRIDDDLLGLLVGSTAGPARATIETAADPLPSREVLRVVARLPDGSQVPMLYPDSLALWALRPASASVH